MQRPEHRVLELITTQIQAQVLVACVQLRLPDLVPASLETLVSATNADSEALQRLLQTLVRMQIFALSVSEADDTYLPTPFSQTLRQESALASLALLAGQPWLDEVLRHLADVVRTGTSGFIHCYHTTLWDYLQQYPDEQQIFSAAISVTQGNVDQVLTEQISSLFSSVYQIVDLGGGIGTQLASLLDCLPGARGILFEQPHVLSLAQDFFNSTAWLSAVKW